MINKAQALHSLRPSAEWVWRSKQDLEWLDTIQPKPTEAEITAEVTRLQAEYDNAQYQRSRAEAYPSLADQADMQYHDAIDGTTTWQDAITAVKAEFPKP
jgi:hypothetical protein